LLAHANLRFRDAVVACSSLAVVGLLVFYAVAAPTAKLRTSFGAIVPRPGTTAIVQGRVLDSDGGGLGGAQVIVVRSGRATGRAVSSDAGTFRIDLRGSCAIYNILLRARALGTDVESATRRHLCPGDALPIDAQVVTQGHFLWVPGPR
jgi:hypothetical protein